MNNRRLWILLGVVLLASFAVLGGFGVKLKRELPPIPERVVSASGALVTDGAAIQRGQDVWRSIGGQEVGSVWGHGSYVAPDWTADWLHREAASVEKSGVRGDALVRDFRTNTFRDGTVTVSDARAAAYAENAAHYAEVFSRGEKAYAIPRGAVWDPAKRADLAAFFWWTSWCASTERPGSDVTYTQNWPHEALVGNVPTSGALLWSIVSVVLLVLGVGVLVTWQASRSSEPHAVAPRDRLLFGAPTPSQRATYKYFAVVALLWLVQMAMGAVVAHYGVEGDGFFGYDLARILPYSVARSWHTQLGIFWIATAWLATGLFVAPAVSGYEPEHQRLGVNVLFGALLVIVVGALAGQWLSVMQKLHGEAWYWFGHQGYEYVDLGRVWQLFLFAGLFIWLGLMSRALLPALRKPSEHRQLLVLFLLSSLAIASFYGAGLMSGRHTHLAMAEYWRWWVVHLWVEGFFEVFATVVVAFIFARLGLVEVRSVTRNVLSSTIVFLAGGIIGTLHHLYFTSSPAIVLSLGAVFSALEIVPLALIGHEAWQNYKIGGAEKAYRWPIYFFVAVAFWNLVGAGVFGFLINPPIALYYMQGLNLTPLHGHTALFGVYGMLGLGLMLSCLRAMKPGAAWRTEPLKWAFWFLNVGLMLMSVASLLPIGVLQTAASIDKGMWYARSAEFMQQPFMQTLRWMRVPGDVLFGAGGLIMAWFVIGLATGWSLETADDRAQIPEAAEAA